MTPERIIGATRKCFECINSITWEDQDRYNHLLYMCDQIPTFVLEGRSDKALVWLGFIQGTLWMEDLATIAEMRRWNMHD